MSDTIQETRPFSNPLLKVAIALTFNKIVAEYRETLTEIPREDWRELRREDWRELRPNPSRLKMFASKHFMVHVMAVSDGIVRLAVSRNCFNEKGDDYAENITWDELLEIKRQVGMADKYAIEIYPPEQDIVNLSNHRHLWVLDKPLDIGWKKNQPFYNH
jgi:hypothetical protein